MNVYGICHICGAIAGKSCKLCGMLTCGKDIDPKTGICATCRRGKMASGS